MRAQRPLDERRVEIFKRLMDEGGGFIECQSERRPRVFLQWKNTAASLDFECECGSRCHFDAEFAYVLKCPSCEALWEMPCFLFPRRNQRPAEYGGVVESSDIDGISPPR